MCRKDIFTDLYIVKLVDCVWILVFDVEEIKLLLIVSCEQWSFSKYLYFSKTYSAVFFKKHQKKKKKKMDENKVTVNDISQSVDL